MSSYEPRYPGTRWRIVYGSYAYCQRHAVDAVQREAQRFQPYVIQTHPAGAAQRECDDHLIVIGTPGDNPLAAELGGMGLAQVPTQPEGYALGCVRSPWKPDRKVLYVVGHDDRGVMYGVHDLCGRVLAQHAPPRWHQPKAMEEYPPRMREGFDGMREFSFHEYPRVARRGLWTWGYVIYDYRRYLDHMAMLRMNHLIVWNDCPPVNAPQIVEYAHSRGIEVVWGFHWGWGRSDIDIANPEHRAAMRKQIVEQYQREYQHVGGDGIYFQTLTEHNQLEQAGRSLAAVVSDWVNEIARGLYEVDPGLYIQFGLHGTSIREHYVDLAALDDRISIVWEDAGVLPYNYNPTTEWIGEERKRTWEDTFESTVEYSKKLATFRPGTEFAMVPKGWTCLRWAEEFEHHGPFILGERDAAFIRRRLEERQPRWDMVNALWLRNYGLGMRFYREVLACKPAKVLAAGLVEDGLFEESIQPSVSLFAQTIWNPDRPEAEVLDQALSGYYR